MLCGGLGGEVGLGVRDRVRGGRIGTQKLYRSKFNICEQFFHGYYLESNGNDTEGIEVKFQWQ